MHPSPERVARWARTSALFVLAAQLASCGGGGPNTGLTPFPEEPTSPAPAPGPSTATAQACDPANPYRADALASTTTGTIGNEKAWLKDYMGGAYLWYAEMPTVNANAAAYSDTRDVPGSLDAYFQALKTPQLTATGHRRDRFSFTYPTKAWNDLALAGVESGYGIQWAIASSTPPRGIRIAGVEAGSPAARAGLQRGDTLVSADGASADANDQAGVDTLNAALFPSANGQTHRFVLQRGGTPVNASLLSAAVTQQPVPTVSVLTSHGRKVGYIVFNAHIATAETALIAAIRQLKAAAVDDLVLDLRYNGGGYLYLASELAYMIAGPARTTGQVFEQLRYNDKRSAETQSADARTPFMDTACVPDAQFNCTDNSALPTLGLSRVSVLTSADTCSASEAIINGLRGVDVDVRLIGGTTCGKPYGFTAKDNCGISYFPIEFEGVNAKGFGDYADGFAATCASSDDLGRALGDPAEGQLATALDNLQTGGCPAAEGRRLPQAAGQGRLARLLRGPEREARVVVPLRR